METVEEEMQHEVLKRQAYNTSMGDRGKLELCSPVAKNFIDRQNSAQPKHHQQF
jgi:hypothetical protein